MKILIDISEISKNLIASQGTEGGMVVGALPDEIANIKDSDKKALAIIEEFKKRGLYESHEMLDPGVYFVKFKDGTSTMVITQTHEEFQALHPTIYLIKPRSKRFKNFLKKHYPEGQDTSYYNNCLVVEHRYFDEFMNHLVNDRNFKEGDDFSLCVEM
jgi:hypothetical protein